MLRSFGVSGGSRGDRTWRGDRSRSMARRSNRRTRNCFWRVLGPRWADADIGVNYEVRADLVDGRIIAD